MLGRFSARLQMRSEAPRPADPLPPPPLQAVPGGLSVPPPPFPGGYGDAGALDVVVADLPPPPLPLEATLPPSLQDLPPPPLPAFEPAAAVEAAPETFDVAAKLAALAGVKSAEPDHAAVAATTKRLDARVRLHRKLIEEINLSAIEKLPEAEMRRQLQELVTQYVHAERLALNSQELEGLFTDIMDEMTGLGPLEPLLKDDTIADILINGHECVFVERRGMLERTQTRFKDEAHLLRIINKIVSAVGRRVDESYPLCDARLLDGSRVNVAIRPIAVDGPLVSIRKFSKKKLSLDKLVDVKALTPQMAEVLAAAVKCKVTLVISGGTGSGKTTMLNALSSFIPESERLITIEDAAELQLQQPHVARMETRPPNVEGRGEIRQRDLVKNALRMRPDRVILGEVRGEEAFDMLQAMNTGHEGSMATIHANNPREAIARLEQMLGMSAMPMTVSSMRSQISAAIRVIVQLSRMSDGKRRVTSIAEITGLEGDILQMQEIYKFVRVKTDEDGTIHGHFQATGVRPRFLTELQSKGISIPGSHFDPSKPL